MLGPEALRSLEVPGFTPSTSSLTASSLTRDIISCPAIFWRAPEMSSSLDARASGHARQTMKLPSEILRVLDLHERWIRNQPGGVRADLTLQDLSTVNLPSINLRGAKLTGCNLSRSRLVGAEHRNGQSRRLPRNVPPDNGLLGCTEETHCGEVLLIRQSSDWESTAAVGSCGAAGNGRRLPPLSGVASERT